MRGRGSVPGVPPGGSGGIKKNNLVGKCLTLGLRKVVVEWQLNMDINRVN